MSEQQRLEESNKNLVHWKKWGPYVSARQWGTVREDYSANGDVWTSVTHDMARSKAYRWGEDGIAGISDDNQLLCFAVGFWNHKDPIIKERFFGLSGHEGNHGEDVKELYYYLDATPSHSYLKMLYKYPQLEFPYASLIAENGRRTRNDPEYELQDTGIFNESRYFDIEIEYAKAGPEDVLIRLTIHNRHTQAAPLTVLPTIWFRNTWELGYDDYRPEIHLNNAGDIQLRHKNLGRYTLHRDQQTPVLFCENETNCEKLYQAKNLSRYCKDGINNYIVHGLETEINPALQGTRAAAEYELMINGGESAIVRLRLEKNHVSEPFADFDNIFRKCIVETENFYADLQKNIKEDELKMIQRQALAGMIWSKQFYYYDVNEWLNGDPAQPAPPPDRKKGRNHEWRHLNNADIISMPDTWEYPWYAAWDLAFHCIPFSMLDPDFAKNQLLVLTKEWYMHPNGQLPAYEWSFSDANPPVHAWATWKVYMIDKQNKGGKGDIPFLETIFHKLLLNFTWWVNRKDAEGNNIFEGGFLGLDNIGIFDRSAPLPNGGYIEQADGTSWMAMYSLNLLRISLELALYNPVYQDMATKFFEHFLYIAGAMADMGGGDTGLWDEEDQFFYDILKKAHEGSTKLKVRSMVGLIPLFAVEVLDHQILEALPAFAGRLKWFLEKRPELAKLVSRWQEKSSGEMHLLSLLRGHRMKMILRRMLDEQEFMSDHGIRSLSRFHRDHPFELDFENSHFEVSYCPGESNLSMFGGNSNWRGPVWLPVNFMLIESLRSFHHYYGEDFKVECPTDSGIFLTLREIADELSNRVISLFRKDQHGKRPFLGDSPFQGDPLFNNYILFHEYFHGENGKGLGASHQTGWTGLVAKMLQPEDPEISK